MNEPIHIDEANFDRLIGSSQVPVLVDFWAPWCGPCRMIAPVLDEIAAERADKAVIAKVNVDENPNLAARYGVRSIPTLVVFAAGEARETIVGRASKQSLLEKLDAAA